MLLLTPLELWGSGVFPCPGWDFLAAGHVDEIHVLKGPFFLEGDFSSDGAQVGDEEGQGHDPAGSSACRAPQDHCQGSTPGAHIKW